MPGPWPMLFILLKHCSTLPTTVFPYPPCPSSRLQNQCSREDSLDSLKLNLALCIHFSFFFCSWNFFLHHSSQFKILKVFSIVLCSIHSWKVFAVYSSRIQALEPGCMSSNHRSATNRLQDPGLFHHFLVLQFLSE